MRFCNKNIILYKKTKNLTFKKLYLFQIDSNEYGYFVHITHPVVSIYSYCDGSLN